MTSTLTARHAKKMTRQKIYVYMFNGVRQIYLLT